MDKVKLLTVEDTWQVMPDMLIAKPGFPVPWDDQGHGWENRAEKVTVVPPDGRELEATAQINMTHLNIPVPLSPRDRWMVRLWRTDRTAEEVPVGSKIFVSPAVRDALLGTPPPNR